MAQAEPPRGVVPGDLLLVVRKSNFFCEPCGSIELLLSPVTKVLMCPA